MTDTLPSTSDAARPFKGKGLGPGNRETEQLAAWVNSLQLPFDGIREAKARVHQLEQRRVELGREADRLRAEFREQFPRGVAPAYLARDTDKTLTPLRWRVSTMADGDDARKRFEFDTELGHRILKQLPPTARAAFMNTEIRRIHLNQAITTTVYELSRLRSFVKRYTAWRRLRNEVRAESEWRRK